MSAAVVGDDDARAGVFDGALLAVFVRAVRFDRFDRYDGRAELASDRFEAVAQPAEFGEVARRAVRRSCRRCACGRSRGPTVTAAAPPTAEPTPTANNVIVRRIGCDPATGLTCGGCTPPLPILAQWNSELESN